MCSIGEGTSRLPVKIRFVEDRDRQDVIALGSTAFPYIKNPVPFFIERMDRCYLFVAEVDGQFAGFIDLEQKGVENTALIAGFAVVPRLRGRGIGTALFSFADRFLKTMGFDKAIIYSEKDNYVANRIYEKFGFRRVEENRAILKWEKELWQQTGKRF